MNALLRIASIALATAAAVWIVPGIRLTNHYVKDQIITLIFVAVIIAFVNEFIKPIAKVLSAPITFLTLGFFALVVNALLLMLVSWIARAFRVGFWVTGFWPAFFGAIIISIVSALVGAFLGVKDND